MNLGILSIPSQKKKSLHQTTHPDSVQGKEGFREFQLEIVDLIYFAG